MMEEYTAILTSVLQASGPGDVGDLMMTMVMVMMMLMVAATIITVLVNFGESNKSTQDIVHDGGDRAISRIGRPSVGTLLLIGILAGLLYFLRPWIHPIIYGLIYRSPGSLQWFVIGLLGILIVAPVLRGRGRNRASTLAFLAGIGIFVVGGFIVGPVAGGVYTQEHLAHERVIPQAQTVDTLPETDSQHPRLLPRSVGHEYTQNSLQYPRHKLGVGDITVLNGTLHWSYGLQPDGLINTFSIHQAGAVYANMETTSKDVRIIEGEFKCGQGQLVTDDYLWQLRKGEYMVDHQASDTFVVPHNGELYLATPYMKYEHKFKALPVPQTYSVPTFGGVALMDTECNVRHLSPSEARESPILDGQNFYPYDLARQEVNAMRYQHGAINKWFYHEDELQIAGVPGANNQQPFTILTKGGGMTYIIAAEPYGEAQGIYQIWVIDARTGDKQVFKLDMQSSLLGPDRASNYVRKENPNVDWSRMQPSEPIPVVVDGDLYWNVRVVPTDSAGVSYTAFVNASSGAVTTVQTDDKAAAFIAGQSVQSDVGGGNQTGSDSSGGGLVIRIEGPDGTQTVTVDEGDTVVIEQRNGTDSSRD